ncbi:MAG TPA: hypothetical protein VK809_04620 [Bacteroidia bacterium]|jgi:hypothetical protein|nr:hypothetical protein [Bacteroidia bacterium]
MKKLAVLLIVICISVGAFARGSGRRYVASLDNKQVVQAQKDSRKSLRNFGSGRRYSAATRGSGFHLFGRRHGSGSRQESGLGL